jgi:formamidopyrimidine-DNA glycosylase
VPELPEVEALARRITADAGGRRLERSELLSISALKTVDPPLASLDGRVLESCGRRGKYLCFDFDGTYLVMHLSRGGWVRWRERLPEERARPSRGPLALRMRLEGGGGLDVTEMGKEKRLALYVVADPLAAGRVSELGPDALDAKLDDESFARILASSSGTVKGVLTDQSLIAGIGNAYSDEALHRARLSPFKPAANLDAQEAARLRAAVTDVLTEALARLDGLPAAELKEEKRQGLAVHARAGEECPVCGDTVREVVYSTRSLQYCPTCQTGGKILADRRLSRLLK